MRWNYRCDPNELELFDAKLSNSSTRRGILFVRHLLGTRLQYNIALALAIDEEVVMDEGFSCFPCLIKRGETAPRPERSIHRHELHVIFVRHDMDQSLDLARR